MKFATDKSHRDYFYKHGVIEFDSLFLADQLHEINTSIDKILAKRLSIPSFQVSRQNPSEIFMKGHDFFRDDENLKKMLLQRRLAEIALELTEARSMRIGYDQLLVSDLKAALKETPYHQFLLQEGTLQEISSVTPVVCGLIICLIAPQPTELPSIFFPKTAGSGVYFKPDLPLDLKFLSDVHDGRYLLITYVDARTVYILNERDPHTHKLKHRGYVFGDRLSDKLNPLISKN